MVRNRFALLTLGFVIGVICGVFGLLLGQFSRRALKQEIARAYRDFAAFQHPPYPYGSNEGYTSDDTPEG